MLALLLSSALPPFPDISYGGPTFRSFVAESYRVGKRKNPGEFFVTMDREAASKGIPSWNAWAAAQPGEKAGDAKRAGEEAWGRIKKTIRKFSVDRGFEFTNVTVTGERQCYLQSVIVAGILQRAGYRAGVAMVWANPKGETSNLGHAVAFVRGPGKDYVVDCSEPHPLEIHRGLFVRLTDGGYRFVRPEYAGDKGIVRYVGTDGRTFGRAEIAGLDVPYLRSQFDYYRGERAPDGILAKRPTPAGLAASAKFFERSLAANPDNPLTRAMLVRTYTVMGRAGQAEAQRAAALRRYERMGWTPGGLRASRSTRATS